MGALNLYAADRGRFVDPDEVDHALLFAVHAAHALASARLVNGLEVAMSSRHVVGVAQGTLVERFGLSVEHAFNALCRISSTRNQKLVDVARHIIDTGSVPTVGDRS